MRKILTQQSVKGENSEYARYQRNNSLQQNTERIRKILTLQSITIEYRENTQDANLTIHYNRIQREYARYKRNNPLQQNTENTRDTNETIHYRRKQREYARYYSNNLLQQKTVNARDTYVAIDYRRKQRMREIPT